ncbi:MAG: hypothetical protein FWH03_07970 [Firmicutes bacterium]|nr:hypothetical protein [Bacillota bacterium]
MIINEKTKIYVAVPAGVKTGGPELLHQLGSVLKSNGLPAQMYYYAVGAQSSAVPEDYLKYGCETADTIEDNENNILIVPEVKTALLRKYKKIQKVIWWLSVNNAAFFNAEVRKQNAKKRNNRFIAFLKRLRINMFFSKLYEKEYKLKKIKKLRVVHLAQSQYAVDYLMRNGIKNVGFLSDYLADDFITSEFKADKQNYVAYNPLKGKEFTAKLIEAAEGKIIFKPIQNLTRNGVIELLRSAKVYIDFGEHPGKDRIPREAAISKCIVITNKKGSAAFAEDVSINEEFKFDDTVENIPIIIEFIQECFARYDEFSEKFESYRQKIKNEHETFDKDALTIFARTQSD